VFLDQAYDARGFRLKSYVIDCQRDRAGLIQLDVESEMVVPADRRE
jgi:hypothetical protein